MAVFDGTSKWTALLALVYKALTTTQHHILLLFPMLVWLCLYEFTWFIPPDMRPVIDVSTLPAVESFFFGSAYLFEYMPINGALLYLTATPYLIHFIMPWTYAVFLFLIDAKPFTFLWHFGVLNLLAVITHVIFPTAPPWYNWKFGMVPAAYEIEGQPARFVYFDELVETSVFGGLYGQSPLVFGSFPSMHAAWPFLIALYSTYLSLPFYRLHWLYMLWVWFAAVYSAHHYLIDLIGGAIYTLVALFISTHFLNFDINLMKRPAKSQTQ